MINDRSIQVREIGKILSVAIAAMLLGSTLILAAVGPARASETVVLADASHTTPATARYLA